MPDISKLDAKVAIEGKLQNVRNALAVLDKHTTQRAKLQGDIDKLNKDEAELIAREDNHEERLQELLRIQAGRTLKVANAETLDQRIRNDEEAVSREANVVSQFLEAFHAAVLVNLQNVIQSKTEAFVLKEDIQHVMQIAMRHPNVRQIHHHNIPFFFKHSGTSYADDVRIARSLDIMWSQMVDAADSIPGELAVSIPARGVKRFSRDECCSRDSLSPRESSIHRWNRFLPFRSCGTQPPRASLKRHLLKSR